MKAYALFIRQGYYGSLPTSQIKEVEFVKKVDFGAIIRVDGSEVKIGAQEEGWLAYGSTFNNTGWYGYAFTPSAAAALQVHWFEENIKEWEERSRKAQEVATKWKEALEAIERQSMKTPPFNTSPDIPVGTRVRYYPVSGEFDFIESVTRTPAWKPYPAADHHYVSIEGKSGGLLLSHTDRAMKTEEEKRAEFDALDGREQQECIALAEMLEEYLGAEYDQYDLVELNQAIKWNLDSLDEMEATPMRSFPSIDLHERCRELERELAKAKEEIALWSRSYVSRHGGKEAYVSGSGEVTVMDWDGLGKVWHNKV